MSTVITEATERIISELEEIGSHEHRAIRFVGKAYFHEALEELASMQLRISEAEHLIRKAIREQ